MKGRFKPQTRSIMIVIFLVQVVFLHLVHVEAQPEGFLRLVQADDVTGTAFGELEIFHDGRWGAICANNFGANESLVACRQLGYSAVVKFGKSRDLSFPGAHFVWLDGITCSGSESRLADCTLAAEYGEESCSFLDTLALFCVSTRREDGAIRLVNTKTGNNGDLNDDVSEGRLEVQHSTLWGGVCENDFGADEATVACRQLGYNGYTRAGPATELGFAEGVTSVLNDVDCVGSEHRLVDCFSSGLQQQSCFGSSNVALICGRQDIPGPLSGGAIVGIVLAGIVLIFLVVIVLDRIRRFNRKYGTKRESTAAVMNVNSSLVQDTSIISNKSEHEEAPKEQLSYPSKPSTQETPAQYPPSNYAPTAPYPTASQQPPPDYGSQPAAYPA